MTSLLTTSVLHISTALKVLLQPAGQVEETSRNNANPEVISGTGSSSQDEGCPVNQADPPKSGSDEKRSGSTIREGLFQRKTFLCWRYSGENPAKIIRKSSQQRTDGFREETILDKIIVIGKKAAIEPHRYSSHNTAVCVALMCAGNITMQ
ncbi:hypothetical protein JTB14_009296 [Gonioctena quinquepunctata]|nr:hypothetical protein JTB14_009296 [Gonioctena quinquepunctata]